MMIHNKHPIHSLSLFFPIVIVCKKINNSDFLCWFSLEQRNRSLIESLVCYIYILLLFFYSYKISTDFLTDNCGCSASEKWIKNEISVFTIILNNRLKKLDWFLCWMIPLFFFRNESLLDHYILIDCIFLQVCPSKFTLAKWIFEFHLSLFVSDNPMSSCRKELCKEIPSEDNHTLSNPQYFGEVFRGRNWVISTIIILSRDCWSKSSWSFIHIDSIRRISQHQIYTLIRDLLHKLQAVSAMDFVYF